MCISSVRTYSSGFKIITQVVYVAIYVVSYRLGLLALCI